jgi:hypothetical protein
MFGQDDANASPKDTLGALHCLFAMNLCACGDDKRMTRKPKEITMFKPAFIAVISALAVAVLAVAATGPDG